jgi:hypothetical protein
VLAADRLADAVKPLDDGIADRHTRPPLRVPRECR